MPLLENLFVISLDMKNPFELHSGRFKINIGELEKIFPNENLIEALKIIEERFPLSVIEKKQILIKLNSLTTAFWLANENGVISIANDSLENFCATANPSGEKESEAFFGEIWEEIGELNKIIKTSKNVVVKENVTFARFENVSYDIVKFPVVDAKDNIVATCGIIQASTMISLNDKKYAPVYAALEQLPVAFAVFNYDGRLIKFSNKFAEKFASDEKNLLGRRVDEIFTKEFAAKVNDLIFTEDEDEFVFEYDLELDEKERLQVNLKKIFNSKDNFIGSLIIFENRLNENFSKILEQEMIDLILSASPDPMFVYDVENLKFLAVNDAAVKFYGYSREQFLQMDLTDLYTPEDIQTLIEFNNSDNETLEKPVKHKLSDGSTVVVRLSRKAIEFEERKAFVTIVKDVSKNDEVNKSLRELKALLEVASEIVFETDVDGFILKVNKTVVKSLAYTQEEITGKTFITLLSENDRSKVNKKVFLAKLREETSFEATIKTKHGASKKAKITVVPLFDVFEELSGYSLIVSLKEEAKKEETATEVRETASEHSSAIDVSFLSHLFHEILTPINVIIGFTQELLESLENPTPEQIESAQIISENQHALMQLIDAATEYAALEQNQERIRPEEFSIIEILDKIEENVKKIARASNVELKFGKISSSIVLTHDKHYLIMFLSMFWEFAIRGTKEGQVYLSAQPEGEFVIVNVRDKKDGISAELLRAMNEFLTEDETLVRRNYNVSRFAVRLFRKLAALLSVSFTEVEKRGEIYAFGAKLNKVISEESAREVSVKELPKKAEPVKKEVPRETFRREVETPKKEFQTSSHAIQQKRISKPVHKEIDLSKLSCLLLEDQVDSQLLFKQQMKELKEIEIFAKFEDALPILRQKKFDFVVMDINLLGDYNGLEALHEIKKIPQYRNVPVIASTAYMMPGDQERYIEAGFDDFVAKPILKNKLIESLKKVL